MAPGARSVRLALAPALALSVALAITACASSTGRSTGDTARGGGARTVRAIPHWVTLYQAAHAPPPPLPDPDGGVSPRDAAVVLPPPPRCPPAAVEVPGGSFSMGSPDGVGDADEHPLHTVTLSPYCLDRLETTVDAFTRCVTAGACTPAAGAQPQGVQPVSGITWEQAVAYCRYVGGRLPTESEWEFAARGTDGRTYPWGNVAPRDCTWLDWTPQADSCGGVGPSPVGTHPDGASPYGAQDMAGNVWEWTADWYATSYPPGPQHDPTGPDTGSARVTRGGGWNNDQTDRVGTTFRQGEHPAFHDYDLGVRCAYDPAPELAPDAGRP